MKIKIKNFTDKDWTWVLQYGYLLGHERKILVMILLVMVLLRGLQGASAEHLMCTVVSINAHVYVMRGKKRDSHTALPPLQPTNKQSA